MPTNDKIKVGKYIVNLTNQEKILFPEDGITKGDIVKYYKDIAPLMLLYTANRALVMQRFPDGIDSEGFYHKDAPEYFPDWIKTVSIPKKGYLKSDNKKDPNVSYVIADHKATVVYLANFGCLTYHLWLSQIDKLDYPDKLIFDLDPSNDKSFKKICKVAKELKIILQEHDLVPFVMSTGSRGLHVIVPIKPTKTFEEVKAFAKEIAQQLISQDPDNLTLDVSKEKRKNKIFIDILRNSFGATSVALYSVRAKAGAPVAFPLKWEELDDPKLTPTKYNIFNIFQRIKKVGDLFKDIKKSAKVIK